MLPIKIVKISIPAEANFILGQAHFIKTVEDLYEAIVNSTSYAKFGIAFCEASGDCLVRYDGNEEELTQSAIKTAMEIGAGHTFVIFIKNAYPINILNAIKNIPEVCKIFCATANPVEVVVLESEQGRGILGVIDGFKPKGVEDPKKMEERKSFLRRIGYKR